jgi:hypothetical protein
VPYNGRVQLAPDRTKHTLMVEAAQRWWWTETIVDFDILRSFLCKPYTDRLLDDFLKSYGGTGIVIPVKKTPQEWKTQDSRGFLQEYAT